MTLSLLAACAGDDVGTSATASDSDGDTSSTGESGTTTDATSTTTTTSSGETEASGTSSSSSETGSMTTGSTSSSTTDDPTTTSDGTTTDSTTTTTTDGTTDGTTTDTGGIMSADCLFEPFEKGNALGFDYDQYMPVIGSHCKGTNHQEITDIERVVFLGDSITVGTPPTTAKDFYRSELADALVERFGLEPPSGLWKQVNLLDGVALQQESGDFASCSKWGARTDDFMKDSDQIIDCLPEDTWDKRTLVVITMGGNDLAAIVEDGANGKPVDECMADAMAAVDLMREAVEYIADPEKFPNGVFVTFANVYEFTDGTADVSACAAAGLDPWEDPAAMIDMVRAVNEAYLEIAVDTQTDMIFMLENFCGHGYRAGDANGPCYRGPNNENYFDLTCIHPTPKGHGVITDLFTAVVDE
ncbi:MAG: SGNH/GDSL hydrolase family protein [Nannocystaceae bacterium]